MPYFGAFKKVHALDHVIFQSVITSKKKSKLEHA